MQKFKHIAGSFELGDPSYICPSYGSTGTAHCYPNMVDAINGELAEFLATDCGVPGVSYSAKFDNTNKYLWIYGIPFLFVCDSSKYPMQFVGPFYNSALGPSSWTPLNVRSSATSNTYSFGVYFTGNPKEGFALRFSTYTTTSPTEIYNASTIVRFINAKNVIDDTKACIYICADEIDANRVKWVYSCELDSDGKPQATQPTMSSYFPTMTRLNCPKQASVCHPNKYPLIPIMWGAYRNDKIFYNIEGLFLPAATTTVTPTQTEVEIQDRRFIITSNNGNTTSTGYINMGLIEITDESTPPVTE